MKSLKVSPAVADDLQQAYDYFNQGGMAAAERFLERYEQLRDLIIRHPEMTRMRATGWRQLAIPRSSYAIFYRETAEFWLLAGVLSTVRDPDLIQAQLLIREIGEEGLAVQ